MFKFFTKICLFILFGYMVGEVITRIYHLNIDVAEFYQDSDGLIKNNPNQKGYYTGGNKWEINKYGQFGYEPKSLDNLITVVGDSYIENNMNPVECHQANFLASEMKQYNFYPLARSGASFIEMMEMTKSVKNLHPKKQLLFVHDGDLTESILEISVNRNTVQWSIISDQIKYVKFASNKLKDILYNFKFAYFLYRNYLVNTANFATNNRDSKEKIIDYDKIQLLLDFVHKNYETNNVVLIFSPDSDRKLTEIVKRNNFKTYQLEVSNYKSWQLENDSHWSCFGHEEASKQVISYLRNSDLNTN